MKVIVIGAGAAGLMAAISAAEAPDCQVLVIEKNEKTGKKIYITGKGRCNLTNDCTTDEFINHVMQNPRFMYSAINAFSPQDMQEFISSCGLKIKTERGGRVFPASDKASDVTKTLEKRAVSLGVSILLNTEVIGLLTDGDIIRGVRLANGEELYADRVIVATGGISYESTGSTGDGYRWAKGCGHDVRPQSPSLVSVKCHIEDIPAGLSLKNVRLTVSSGKKQIISEFGEMLFTHDGISGPIVLTATSVISGKYDVSSLEFSLDFKPALSEDELDARLVREFDAAKNKNLKNVMRTLLPESITENVVRQCGGLLSETPVHDITKAERAGIVRALKNFRIDAYALGGFNEAVITRGGVSTKDINPATMESKKIKGLYFAGEVIDVDATTGGYNLQIAWSTGRAAGKAAAGKE